MSLTIFIILLIIAIIGWVVGAIAKFNINEWWKSTVDGLFSKPVLLPFSLAVAVFIAASVVPYTAQMNDRYYIAFAEENIKLYNQYIDDYAAAAQKQISEYQQAQAQLAKTATSLQLQFYSQQIDTVGNKLTDQIKLFNDKILEWKIEINRARVRMQLRPLNKWVFGL